MDGFRPWATGRFAARTAVVSLWGWTMALCPCALVQAETVTVAGREFEIPDGFVFELIAGPDLVPRPIVADFNERGDLFVADSSGSNDDVQKQLEERPHRVLRLRDTDGDGRFDESSVFADRMMFPEGVMYHQGSIYVAAPPQIWKLTDRDDDGVAEEREVWFDGKTLTGCANDLHGPYLGPDGWIYWCKGAFAEQTYEQPDGGSWTTRAAHIFRRRPEGGFIEPVMTGGMDNPVDVVFTAAGERIFTTTFLQHPAGGLRDGLIHAIYGGVYGKSHGVLDGHPRTGDLMPVLSHLGPAAPCGLTRLDGDLLGAEYDGNLLSCAFNLHQVTRHELEPDEATFRSRDSVMLATADLDFHPTDVLQDADGSIVVLDTGGWYKLCCPTSQLAKPDVLGGIYRLSRRGTVRPEDPRGLTIDWQHATHDQLIERLDDARHVVRERATAELAARGEAALPALERALAASASERVRRQAIWAACRIDDPASVAVLIQALSDRAASVRQASCHALSVRREVASAAELTRCLSDVDPAVCRAAAEAVGRMRFTPAIPQLLEQMSRARGRVLEHSLTYALIEIGDAEALRAAWPSADAAARRAILVALDQIDGEKLEADRVVESLTADDDALRRTAQWIVSRHPDWADVATDQVLKHLATRADRAHESSELTGLIAQFLEHGDVQQRVAETLCRRETPASLRTLLCECLQRYSGDALNDALQRSLAEQLASGESARIDQAVGALAAYPRHVDDPGLLERLRAAADDPDRSLTVRLQAMAVLRGSVASIPSEWFTAALRASLDDEDFARRRLATDVLTGAPLTRDQMAEVIRAFPQADPVELGELLGLLKRTGDTTLAALAIDRLGASEAAVVLTDSLIREAFAHFRQDEIRQAVDRLLAERMEGQTAQAARLHELLARLPEGDVRRGQQVFHSSKAACFACHAMGYRGGDIGPDLTRIGRIRARRDLLEAIAFPSLSFVRSYEPVSVVTRSGVTIQGVVKDENAERLVLVNDQRKVIEIRRSDVELIQPGRVSIMPSGLDQLLSDEELADLLAFLEAAR